MGGWEVQGRGHLLGGTEINGFPRWLDNKLPTNAGTTGDVGSSLGLGRPPGEGNGNLLQYSCLGSPMDRGAWQAAVHGVEKELNVT